MSAGFAITVLYACGVLLVYSPSLPAHLLCLRQKRFGRLLRRSDDQSHRRQTQAGVIVEVAADRSLQVPI